MLIDREINNLKYKELLIAYDKLEKRLERIIKQGDRQQKQVHELNEKLNKYIGIVEKNVIISTFDLKGKILYTSEAFCKISGYQKVELIDKSDTIFKDMKVCNEGYENLWNTISNGQIWKGELKNRKKDGTLYWVNSIITPNFEDGVIHSYTNIMEDITDKKIIEELSITDGLTSLYNRRHFNNTFPKEINRAKREEHFLSFLIIDVDNFKKYNDTYGHQEGDEVLKKIGIVLKNNLNRAGDFAFRLGGEEFGAIFSGLNKFEALNFANKIREDIQNLNIEHKLNIGSIVTASMGLIVFKEEYLNADTIYKLADNALYLAKEEGRNRVILGES